MASTSAVRTKHNGLKKVDKHALTLVNGTQGRRGDDKVMWDVMCVVVLVG